MDRKKVFVFGIDGADPEFIFNKWVDEFPCIKSLLKEGIYAKLNSTVPPLTAVAWTSMRTGLSPSDHGLFEYVYRKKDSYANTNIISANNINEKSIWHIASESNKKSIVCLVPITWPIKPFNGIMVSGFLTPKNKRGYIYPLEKREEIESIFNEPFEIDIYDHRKLSKEELFNQCCKMTKMHFKLMEHLIKNKEWDLFFGVIATSDWMNHGFFRYADELHRNYDPNSKFKDTLKDYYKLIDRNLSKLISSLDEDTTIIIVSDHGMKRIHNRFNLSDWLLKEGYLVLKQEPKKKTELTSDLIDWEKTKVWAIGAYEGQIFINLKGREPKGIVEKKDYDKLIEELMIKLKKIRGDDGSILDTKFFKKERDFQGKNNKNAPDLMVYFDDLQYGCNNSYVKNKTSWNIETKKGNDDATHSQQGIFIMNKSKQKGNIGEIDILDVAPTILNKLDIKIPEDMKGKIIE